MFGILNINKPVGLTSRRVVDRLEKCLGRVKAGHAGTLDPLAEGVLLVCVGPATRLVNRIHQLPKRYRAAFRLGVHSETLDVEGDLQELQSAPVPSLRELEQAVAAFVGRIQQVPPNFSAVKVNGKRAYRLARQEIKLEIDSRPVDIHSMQLTAYNYPDFELEVECGSGTYIRSLGRDIAARLSTAAVMTALKRTSIGHFAIEQSIQIADFSKELVNDRLISPVEIFRGSARKMLGDDQLDYLANGGLLDHEVEERIEELVGIGIDDRLFAVMGRSKSGAWKPSTNFAKYWLAEQKR